MKIDDVRIGMRVTDTTTGEVGTVVIVDRASDVVWVRFPNKNALIAVDAGDLEVAQ